MGTPLDFPNAPTLNQKYPQPPITGLPVYTWDGEKWMANSGPAGGLAGVFVSDTPPVGVPDNSLWWESDTGNFYIRYNDGNSSQWVIMPQAISANAVAYTPQTPTTAQQVVARQNVYAAPFDAMAYNGLQINGSFEINQERGNVATGVSATTTWNAQDGWIFYFSGSTLAFTILPMNVNTGNTGFPYCLLAQSTVGKPALGATDQIFMEQRIEGTRLARMGWGSAMAQPLTIGFWAFSSAMAGNMSVAILGAAGGNRSYVTSVPINFANTWEFKTVTIPGDVAGTWAKDAGVGMYVRFCFGAGTTIQTPTPNAWNASGYSATAQQTNFHSAPNYTGLTGVIILPGLEAPSAARSPLIMRPYDQELITCQRYYEKSYPMGEYFGQASSFFVEQYIVIGAGNAQGSVIPFKVRKRGPPTMRVYSPSTGAGGVARGVTAGADKAVNIDIASEYGVSIFLASPANDLYRWNFEADARI